MTLLQVRNLRTSFATRSGQVRAVNDLSFEVGESETIAIVGESGCGKSAAAMSILRLISKRVGEVSGQVEFEGQDLLALDDEAMRQIRGNRIGFIFQEPTTSLNPVLTVGWQIAEAVRLHKAMPKKLAMEKAVEMLGLVGISEPEHRVREYPHQLSGGMQQRAMIALALVCGPKLLIADEPTTALDVTIQAQILNLIRSLRSRFGSAVLLITHDLGVVAEMAERVIVMYAGRKVEEASVNAIFTRPRHPYTRALLRAVPKLGASSGERAPALLDIPGQVPSPREQIVGCAFSDRCEHSTDVCRVKAPVMTERDGRHFVSCHLEE